MARHLVPGSTRRRPAPDGDDSWRGPERRLRHLQLAEVLLLAAACAALVLVTVVMGRTQAAAQQRERVEDTRLASLHRAGDALHRMEMAFWQVRAEGGGGLSLRFLPVALTWDARMQEVLAQPATPSTSAVRDEVVDARADLLRIMRGVSLRADASSIPLDLIGRGQAVVARMERAMEGWIEASTAESARLHEQADAGARRMSALQVGLALALVLGGLVAWALIDRTRRRLTRAAAARDARFRALVTGSSDAVMRVGADGRVAYCSPAVTAIAGRDPADVEGAPLAALAHPDDREAVAGIGAGPGTGAVAWRMRRRTGGFVAVETVVSDHRDDPDVAGLILATRDVTARRAAEARLAHQALHDPLTDLANRVLFMDRTAHALARASRGGGEPAVVMIDLDDFKTVNDTLGHAAGDALLVEVAGRLREAVRAGDTVARLGGDEFAVLLEGADARDEAVAAADRLLGAVRAPLALPGRTIALGASAGVAFTEPGATAQGMLRDADLALYAAKDGGRGTVRVCLPHMRERAERRLGLGEGLRAAIALDQLFLEYQPVVDITSGRVVALEALVRWRHPVWGMLAPGEFIPAAEEMDVIVDVGRWVLREACRVAAGWPVPHHGQPPMVSVNVSAAQVVRADLAAHVGEALAAAGLPAARLALEVTETTVLRDPERAAEVLGALERTGVRLALDDFGTGHSSLAWLRRLPVHVLKLDRSFVQGGDEAAREWRLTGAIMQMGEALGLLTVAEGVETPEQLERMRGLGCRLAQGFLLARPVPAERVPGLVGACLLPRAPAPARVAVAEV
jgi:diguanylate cyclase (GGDEF)-like protein/PAS domain S-box-containing protein